MKTHIDKFLKKASIADFNEWNGISEISSYATHITILGKNEEWPKYQALPMFPLLQIIIDELPFVPERLAPFKAITVFVKSELVDGKLHCNYPNHCDDFEDQYEIRSYKSLEDIQLVDFHHKFETYPRAIHWKLSKNDAPSYEEMLNLLEEDVNLKRLYKTLRKDYHTDTGFKVGGYPCLWQGRFEGIEDYCFQLGVLGGECLLGDEGNAYVMLDEEGDFYLKWQSS